ncbi:hypothetical protein [Nonomuraea montanisoli]|nr:hypothetical protein [Nonomuraea montanisoli]
MAYRVALLVASSGSLVVTGFVAVVAAETGVAVRETVAAPG